MKGYKAFNKGLVCRGKRYAENTVFEEEDAEICRSGMHFCKNPLDVLDYYPLIDNEGNVTEFAEVEALDDVKTNDGKKFCTKKLKIGAKLSLWQFIKASFDVAYQNIKSQVEVSESTRFAGDNNAKLIGGGYAKLVGSNYAELIGGGCAKLAGGKYAKIVGGNNATLAGGYDAIIVGDNGSVAKGKKGSIIVLVERNYNMNIVNFKAVQVDGEEIKEDVLYKLENGEFVEVE
ncbi:MAG: hypothetical protein ACLSGD_07760 [Ruminococcus sp.]